MTLLRMTLLRMTLLRMTLLIMTLLIMTLLIMTLLIMTLLRMTLLITTLLIMTLLIMTLLIMTYDTYRVTLIIINFTRFYILANVRNEHSKLSANVWVKLIVMDMSMEAACYKKKRCRHKFEIRPTSNM